MLESITKARIETLRGRVVFAFGLASTLAGGGCLNEASTPLSPHASDRQTGQGSETVLASVTLDDGSLVKFIEVEVGIVMSAAVPETDEERDFAGFDAAEPVALYERLSNEAAPAALVAAQERVLSASGAPGFATTPPPPDAFASRLTEAPTSPEGDRSEELEGRAVWYAGRLNAGIFRNRYCGDRTFYGISWDEVGCWTGLRNWASTPWRYARRFFSLAHCYDQADIGLFHGLEYWNGSGWSILHPFDTIEEGQSSVFSVWITSGPWYLRSWVDKDLSFEYPDQYHLTFKTAN